LLIIIPRGLNIICCGRLSAMLHDIHLQQTIFNKSRRYSSDGDDIHLEQTIFIRWKRYSFKKDEYHLWWLILEITIKHWRWFSTTGDINFTTGRDSSSNSEKKFHLKFFSQMLNKIILNSSRKNVPKMGQIYKLRYKNTRNVIWSMTTTFFYVKFFIFDSFGG
jgi:hypothetical protein